MTERSFTPIEIISRIADELIEFYQKNEAFERAGSVATFMEKIEEALRSAGPSDDCRRCGCWSKATGCCRALVSEKAEQLNGRRSALDAISGKSAEAGGHASSSKAAIAAPPPTNPQFDKRESIVPSKREFLDRVVKELNLDLSDPFTLIFANAAALSDACAELRQEIKALRSSTVAPDFFGMSAKFVRRYLYRWTKDGMETDYDGEWMCVSNMSYAEPSATLEKLPYTPPTSGVTERPKVDAGLDEVRADQPRSAHPAAGSNPADALPTSGEPPKVSGMPLIKRLREQRDGLADVLRWLDVRGGLGHDVHERIRKVLVDVPTYEQQLRNICEGVGVDYDEMISKYVDCGNSNG